MMFEVFSMLGCPGSPVTQRLSSTTCCAGCPAELNSAGAGVRRVRRIDRTLRLLSILDPVDDTTLAGSTSS
jgi:hypothetical protein